MELFYTTSAGFNQVQTDPLNSLGGFKSSSVVKNDDFGNLFGEITPYTIRQNRDEYIALILQNTTTGEVTNTELWIEVVGTDQTPYASFTFAAVTTTADADGNPKMERVRDRFTKPFIGNFAEATTTNRLQIGTLDTSAQVGIWIRRTLDITAINQDANNIYERDPNNNDIYREVVRDTQDVFNIRVTYQT